MASILQAACQQPMPDDAMPGTQEAPAKATAAAHIPEVAVTIATTTSAAVGLLETADARDVSGGARSPQPARSAAQADQHAEPASQSQTQPGDGEEDEEAALARKLTAEGPSGSSQHLDASQCPSLHAFACQCQHV